MYQLKRFVDGWAVINDDTGSSRLLDKVEVVQLQSEFAHFNPIDKELRSLFVDDIRSLQNLPR